MRIRTRRRPVESRRDETTFRHPDTRPDNWLAHRMLSNALVHAAPEHIRGRLLDVGCGLKPYAPLLAPYVSDHVGVDHPDSPHSSTVVDVLADAYEIPLAAGSFDTVLLTEVLEHLERPGDALSECCRLLKPGGKLVLSTPFVWVIHEAPRDFFRYTPFGLEFLLRESGLEVVEMTPLGGQWITIALMFGYALGESPLQSFPRLLRVAQRVLQHLGAHANHHHFRSWLSHSHLAVAEKPSVVIR